MSEYPPVHVSGAPGYEDFDGVLVLACTPDWPVNKHVVGFEIDGQREVAVVPAECVTLLEEDKEEGS